jgi:bifunctional DNA-binding transcriptional regulator/antitoxin component of YhaV-PrlF toxin-antitoxin module
MVSRVSDRGQITIDRGVRRELGVRPGMVAHQRVVNGHLEIVFLPEPHSRSLYGAFRNDSGGRAMTDPNDVEEAVMAAVAQEQSHAGEVNA